MPSHSKTAEPARQRPQGTERELANQKESGAKRQEKNSHKRIGSLIPLGGSHFPLKRKEKWHFFLKAETGTDKENKGTGPFVLLFFRFFEKRAF